MQIKQQCQFNINKGMQHNIGEANSYYCPDLIEYLLTYYLPILPLWRGIILSPIECRLRVINICIKVTPFKLDAYY